MRPRLPSLGDLVVGARLVRQLRPYLRHPVGVEEARRILRGRLEHRERDFLGLAKRAIFENPESPYRPLLKLAGCEYGDLEQLVRDNGIEGALQVLCRDGVYLTVDEFKGRRAIVRGSATIALDPAALGNPLATAHVAARTGGSRSAGTTVLIDLAFFRENAVDACLVYDAFGGRAWQYAVWGVPGSTAIVQILRYSGIGHPPTRWFSKVDAGAPELHPRYRWSARMLRWGSLLAGVPLPAPEHVPLENPRPILRWMAGVLRGGGVPHLHTTPSSAVRLCLAALEAGVHLSGVRLSLGSEPMTAARRAVLDRAGVAASVQYAAIEAGGMIAYGCLAPDAPDDMHFLHDLHAVVQAGSAGGIAGLPSSALLLSSLRSTAPLILLNVSMGDQAEVADRACRCPLERLGWGTHFRSIRSYEKLTCAGMTFLDTDVVRVLEEVLPARFGGAPTDYQLVEEETADGQPRLRLLVHPEVGSVDADLVVETLLSALGAGSGAERVMELLWRDAALLRVERRAPLTTAAGKILHLHVCRPSVERSTRAG